MRGQIIKNIFRSSSKHNWALLETNLETYELRLGGIKLTSEKRSEDFVIDISISGKVIEVLKTDDFGLYFELEDGGCFMHSDTFVNDDGTTSFGVEYLDEQQFNEAKKEWYGIDAELKIIESKN